MSTDGSTHDFEETVGTDGTDGTDFSPDEIRVAKRITDLNTAAMVLRIVAVVTVVLWLYGFVITAWTAWDNYSQQAASSSQSNTSALTTGANNWKVLRQASTVTIAQAWPFLALAIAAYVSSVLLAMRYEDALTRFVAGDDEPPGAPPPG